MKKLNNVRTVKDYLNDRSSFKPDELLDLRELIIRSLDKSHVSKDNTFLKNPPKMVVELYKTYKEALDMIDEDLRWLIQQHNQGINKTFLYKNSSIRKEANTSGEEK